MLNIHFPSLQMCIRDSVQRARTNLNVVGAYASSATLVVKAYEYLVNVPSTRHPVRSNELHDLILGFPL